jgi:hypothetical protein
MKLFIHIGSDKCGSTSIQVDLFHHQKLLEKQGIFIPKSGLSNDTGHEACFLNGPTDDYFELIKELQKAENYFEKAIISWEGIHFMQREILYKHFSELRNFDAVAIYYIREQSELIQSGILQNWKAGDQKNPFNMMTPPQRKYYEIATLWTDFLNNKCIVRLFDRESLKEGDVIEDFYHIVGANRTESNGVKRQERNDSISYESAFLLSKIDQYLNPGNFERRQWVRVISEIQKNFPFHKYFLSKAEVEKIRGHYQGNNQRLTREYELPEINLDKITWMEPKKEPECTEEMLCRAWAIFERLEISRKRTEWISGWYGQEPWGRWCSGDCSLIGVNLTEFERKSGIQLTIYGRYFIKLPFHSDLIIRGYRSFPDVNLTCFITYIPAEAIPQSNRLILEIRHPFKTSPSAHNLNTDTRELSFGLFQLRWEALSPSSI